MRCLLSTGCRWAGREAATAPQAAAMDIAPVIAACSIHTQGLVTPKMLGAAGVAPAWLSREQRRGSLLRIRERVYAREPLPALPRFLVTETGVAPVYVAHVRAVLLSLGSGAAARARTAAALRGWGLLVEPVRTVEVAVHHGRGRTRLRGVRLTQHRQLDAEPLQVLPDTEPLLLTSSVRTVVDACLELPLLEAVVLCDSALRAADVTVEQIALAARRLAGTRYARRVRRVLELADPQSGSVLESVQRVRMVLGGLTGFATQVVLRDALGRHVLRTDFCFEAARLIVEVDGKRWHPDPPADRRRDNQLAALGWRVLRYTWAQVVHEPAAVLAEIGAALGCCTSDIHLVMAEDGVAA